MGYTSQLHDALSRISEYVAEGEEGSAGSGGDTVLVTNALVSGLPKVSGGVCTPFFCLHPLFLFVRGGAQRNLGTTGNRWGSGAPAHKGAPRGKAKATPPQTSRGAKRACGDTATEAAAHPPPEVARRPLPATAAGGAASSSSSAAHPPPAEVARRPLPATAAPGAASSSSAATAEVAPKPPWRRPGQPLPPPPKAMPAALLPKAPPARLRKASGAPPTEEPPARLLKASGAPPTEEPPPPTEEPIIEWPSAWLDGPTTAEALLARRAELLAQRAALEATRPRPPGPP